MVSSYHELLHLLDLGDSPLAAMDFPGFPLRVPRPYIARMEKGNPDDPLLKQVLPVAEETVAMAGYGEDPLEESSHNPVPGLIHKYFGRVLLVTSPACAIHCRYCFRRHFPYQDNNPGKGQWRRALDYIATDDSISEVILSGGDPLSASDSHLQWLVERIADIPHVRRLRVHSRLPVVIPARIDDHCLSWLTGTRLQPVMVLHCNHGNEIDEGVRAMVARLRARDIPVLNQAVLLRGVNDSVDALAALSERLFTAGILPYYLHLMDAVAGAGHFDLDRERALGLYQQLEARLPGYLVPKLVREIPGEASKTQVGVTASA